jgi:CRP/FNR family transcriptional regulator, cyclic AMP receptor protein
VLCREGHTGTECFVVRSGEATVTIAGDEVASIGPGGFFGELALLDGAPRVATVTAATDLSVVVLSRSEFDQMPTRLPGISRRILRAVAARLRAVDNRLLDARLGA